MAFCKDRVLKGRMRDTCIQEKNNRQTGRKKEEKLVKEKRHRENFPGPRDDPGWGGTPFNREGSGKKGKQKLQKPGVGVIIE